MLQTKYKKSKILSLSLVFLGLVLVASFTLRSNNKRFQDLDIFYTATDNAPIKVGLEILNGGSTNIKVNETRTIALKVTQDSTDTLNGLIFSIKVPSNFEVTGLTPDGATLNDTNRKNGFMLTKTGLEGYVFTQTINNDTYIRIAAATNTPTGTFTLATGDTIAQFGITAKTAPSSGTANITFDLDTIATDSNGARSYPAIVKSTGGTTLNELDVLANSFNTLAFTFITGCQNTGDINGDNKITVLGDLLPVVNMVLNNIPIDMKADVDCNNSVNTIDLILLINKL